MTSRTDSMVRVRPALRALPLPPRLPRRPLRYQRWGRSSRLATAGVAGHDRTASAHRRPDRVGRGDRGCLVEGHNVETPLGTQLGDDQRDIAQHVFLGVLPNFPVRQVTTRGHRSSRAGQAAPVAAYRRARWSVDIDDDRQPASGSYGTSNGLSRRPAHLRGVGPTRRISDHGP